jgi:hypothetical protein
MLKRGAEKHCAYGAGDEPLTTWSDSGVVGFLIRRSAAAVEFVALQGDGVCLPARLDMEDNESACKALN